MEGLEDLLGLWLRRMSTAPTTSESMATNKASVAYAETKVLRADRAAGDVPNTTEIATVLLACVCALPGSHVPGAAAGCPDSRSRW